MTMGLAAMREQEGEPGEAEDALRALASAARRVEKAAAAGSPLLLAGALVRLAEATLAAEELGARRIAVRVVAETAALSRHLRAVR
jgi:hypothetical protein